METFTTAQTTQLAAQVLTWLQDCALEDPDFDPSFYNVHVALRPSGVADLFYRSAEENPFHSEPYFHLGYVYPSGKWVEVAYMGQEVPFSYWDNSFIINFTNPAA